MEVTKARGESWPITVLLTVNICKQQVGSVPLISVDSRLILWCLFIVAIKVEREAAGRRSQSNMKEI